MPVNLTFDSQDAIPEGLRDHAVEKDGKYVFEAETAVEVGNLKGTLRKEREARTRFEAAAKKAERFKSVMDADEDEVEQFLEHWTKRGETPPGSPDAAKQAEISKKLHEKELKRYQSQLDDLSKKHGEAETALREYRLWTPVRDIALKAGLFPEDWELARLELAQDNRFGFDEDGKIVVMEEGVISTVTPERFFKEVYSEKRPKMFRANDAGGSGASSGTRNNPSVKAITRAQWEKLSSQESTAFFKGGGKLID